MSSKNSEENTSIIRMQTKYSFAVKAKDTKTQENTRVITDAEEIDKMPRNVNESLLTRPLKPSLFFRISNFFPRQGEEEVVIYNEKSGILSDNLIKEDLLNSVEKDKRRLFRENFKRALLVERIHFRLPEKDTRYKAKSNMVIKWNKLPLQTNPVKFVLDRKYWRNRRTPGFPNTNQQMLSKSFYHFPIFSIENNLKQIILAYPAEAFIKNWEDRLYDWYYRIFEWEKDTRATNIGFFFFNPKDAITYEHSVRKFGPLAAHDLGTKLAIIRLSNAYDLNRTSAPETRFLFIPDMEEVVNLLTSYRSKYGRKMQFHPDQKITKDGFANQPIYLIKDIKIRQGLLSSKIISYQGNLKDHAYIFLTLEGAEFAWKTFCEKNPQFNLPSRPNILVYNFDSFVKDYENSKKDLIFPYEKFFLISNRETYEKINELNKGENKQNELQRFYNKRISSSIFFIKLWANRFRLVLFHAPRINEYPRRELFYSEEAEEN
uniref:hypothetical protein n=1 Tax=Rhodaphanes brevistipitata TaxID=446136 RepID=UPI001FCDB7D0|nr:hypothetical protein MW432_pgp196 [Rhodaphanes brevistipitata]UNJ18385.1 hypothetical protein [Rhodaphanes brevistipitata]